MDGTSRESGGIACAKVTCPLLNELSPRALAVRFESDDSKFIGVGVGSTWKTLARVCPIAFHTRESEDGGSQKGGYKELSAEEHRDRERQGVGGGNTGDRETKLR